MSARPTRKIPRILVDIPEAAAALDLSEGLFRSEVLPQLPVVSVGRRQLVAVEDLHAWVDTHKVSRSAPRGAQVARGRSATASRTESASSSPRARELARKLSARVERSVRKRLAASAAQAGADVSGQKPPTRKK